MEPELDHVLAGLMRRAQDGDRQAYESLLLSVTALLRAFVHRRLHGDEGVEDIVQDTLLSIHRHRHTYDPTRPFGPWMYGIARHRLIDFVRRRKRRTDKEVAEDAAPEGAAPTESPSIRIVHEALALLTRKQRDIIEMLKIEGRSVAEIAVKTGLSRSSIKVTAHRGYKKLRALIEEDVP